MQPENIDLVWIWSKLQAGIKTNKNDYHLMQFGYIDEANVPKIDTVVCRQLANRHVYFHTDFRSHKVECLKKNAHISLHWYSKEEKTQISFQAIAKIHHLDDVCRQKWQNMQVLSQECYHQVGKPGETYAPELATFNLSEKEAFENLAIIACDIKKMDILLLRIGDNIRYVWSEGDDALSRVIA